MIGQLWCSLGFNSNSLIFCGSVLQKDQMMQVFLITYNIIFRKPRKSLKSRARNLHSKQYAQCIFSQTFGGGS